MVLYSLTAGHKGFLTQGVWHSIWRLYTTLDCPSQSGTNTYADFKAKQDVWNYSVKCGGGIIKFYFPVSLAKAGQPWTLSQAVHLAKEKNCF